MYGATTHVISSLQAVLNAVARLITGITRIKHITPVLRDVLHWLPVRQRITYKIALLVYKCLHGIGLAYLSEWCTLLSASNAVAFINLGQGRIAMDHEVFGHQALPFGAHFPWLAMKIPFLLASLKRT